MVYSQERCQITYVSAYPVRSAAINPRYAAVITRHRIRSGEAGVSAGDGDQDADTVPEPVRAGPAPPSTAALRSVHGPKRRFLPHQRPRPRASPGIVNRRMNTKGVNFQPSERGQFSTAVDSTNSAQRGREQVVRASVLLSDPPSALVPEIATSSTNGARSALRLL